MRAYVDPDEDSTRVLGEVLLRVMLEQPTRVDLALVLLDQEAEGEQPTDDMEPVADGLHVDCWDAGRRAEMVREVSRLPAAFTREVAKLMRAHEHYVLRVEAGRLEVQLPDLETSAQDWLEQTADLPEQLRALGGIAAIVDGAQAGIDAVCRYCACRYLPDASRRCPSCGAPT